MEDYLDTLPKSQDDYGFIHNDNHQRNILVLNRNITIIDFDCAGRQFFIQDITTPAQGIMFDITGGMLSPLHDSTRLKRFFDSFVNGYEKENHLADFWYKEITTFINYRRLLLFTCMQDWLNTEPGLKDGIIGNIKNPPQILI
jgi:Ser/Thr protein kinase RdoA (MazF antagonist)